MINVSVGLTRGVFFLRRSLYALKRMRTGFDSYRPLFGATPQKTPFTQRAVVPLRESLMKLASFALTTKQM